MSRRHPLAVIGLYWLGFVAILLGFALCVPLPPDSPRPIPTATLRVLAASPTPFVFVQPPTVTPRESVLAPTRTPAPPTPTFTPIPTKTPDQGTRVPTQRG
jgi:hypothetical protein